MMCRVQGSRLLYSRRATPVRVASTVGVVLGRLLLEKVRANIGAPYAVNREQISFAKAVKCVL